MSGKIICDFCGKENNDNEMVIFGGHKMCSICENEQIKLNNKHRAEWEKRMEERKNSQNNHMHNMVQEAMDNIYDPTKNCVFFTKYMKDKWREEVNRELEEADRESRRVLAESWAKAKYFVVY